MTRWGLRAGVRAMPVLFAFCLPLCAASCLTPIGMALSQRMANKRAQFALAYGAPTDRVRANYPPPQGPDVAAVLERWRTSLETLPGSPLVVDPPYGMPSAPPQRTPPVVVDFTSLPATRTVRPLGAPIGLESEASPSTFYDRAERVQRRSLAEMSDQLAQVSERLMEGAVTAGMPPRRITEVWGREPVRPRVTVRLDSDAPLSGDTRRQVQRARERVTTRMGGGDVMLTLPTTLPACVTFDLWSVLLQRRRPRPAPASCPFYRSRRLSSLTPSSTCA